MSLAAHAKCCCWGLQAAQGGSAADGGPNAAALQAHLDSAMQSGLIQMNGFQPSEAGLGGPNDPARDGSQSAGVYSYSPNPPPLPLLGPPLSSKITLFGLLSPYLLRLTQRSASTLGARRTIELLLAHSMTNKQQHHFNPPCQSPSPAGRYYSLLYAAVFCNLKKKCLWRPVRCWEPLYEQKQRPSLLFTNAHQVQSGLLRYVNRSLHASVQNYSFLH